MSKAKLYIGILLFLLPFIPAKAEDGNNFIHRLKQSFINTLEYLSEVDTNYIEPQAYTFTAMLQNTNTYESYSISNKKGQSVRFAPKPSFRVGPYFGWRWIFLGYTLDLRHLNDGNKNEFDLSLYTSSIGIDLYYKNTGNNYTIKNVKIDPDVNTQMLRDVRFDGIKASNKGFNLYYIFNHRHFSYPAAFSQSTIQRRSCGSAIAGIGYNTQTISINQRKLINTISDKMGTDLPQDINLESFDIGEVDYIDISLMGGYAYNWVFAKQWLLAGSYALALAYKHSRSYLNKPFFSFDDFSFNNINIDGVGRFGIVYNNMRWYAGASLITHNYSYHKSQFHIMNSFGTLNFYVGWNFSRRK